MLELCRHSESLSSVLSSYSFTVAGFLATIATFVLALGGKSYFEHYKRRGSFDDLVMTHVLTLAMLGAVFVLSVFILAHPSALSVKLLISAAGGSFLLLCLLTVSAYNLARRSSARE